MPTRQREIYRDGQLVDTVPYDVPQETVNEEGIEQALRTARQTIKAGLDAARADRQAWPTMTNAQKDRANRDSLDRDIQTARVLLDLVRQVQRDFAAGPEA